MDKKFLIPLLLLGLAGCLNDLEYTPGDTEPRVIMNALLTTDEAEHTVYLALSRPGTVDTLRGDASVKCYVNGSLAAAAAEQPGSGRQRRFTFSAPLSAGDEVRIDASVGEYSASASATVLSQPLLGQVDTSSVWTDDGGRYDFRIAVSDSTPGTDYYTLGIIALSQIHLFLNGVQVGTETFRYRCSLDTSSDLILSEDNIASSNMDGMFSVGTPNTYGAFLDNQFDCGSAVLRPKIDKNMLNSWWMNTTVEYDSLWVEPSIRVELSHIADRHYYYLKALNSLDYGNSDLSLEETAIPDNVDGGIGFVGVSNTASKSFALKPYSPTVYHYSDDEFPEDE